MALIKWHHFYRMVGFYILSLTIHNIDQKAKSSKSQLSPNNVHHSLIPIPSLFFQHSFIYYDKIIVPIVKVLKNLPIQYTWEQLPLLSSLFINLWLLYLNDFWFSIMIMMQQIFITLTLWGTLVKYISHLFFFSFSGVDFIF